MFGKYSPWRIFIVFLSSMNFTLAAGNYRENHALRHPCNSVNKQLEPYITWTEKLASSQYRVQTDGCGRISSGPACCTHEVMNSYASSLSDNLTTLLDSELIHLSRIFSVAKQQTSVWSKEYIIESRRLTISSLETLFGTKEYRSNIHPSVSTLFNTLSVSHASVDDVSRSTIDLLNHLIISLYRQFILNNNNLGLDDKFQKCLVNKAFDIDAFPTQRELLYTLTSGSSLFQIFRTMLIYIDADIQGLKTTATLNSNPCLERYARETLCPICVSTSSSSNRIHNNNNNNIREILCENDCQYLIKTCFNETNNPYVAFASIAKGYVAITKEIEQAVIELKLVERLSKLHIYFYDMVVNATNSRRIYTQLQSACPNPNVKSFSPILSLPPTTNERPELVYRWNRSIHFLLKQIQSSIDDLYMQFTQQIIKDICANSKYAAKSNQCTQIDKQTTETVQRRNTFVWLHTECGIAAEQYSCVNTMKTSNLMQWQLPSIPHSTLNINHGEPTRNQLDELKKKMIPIQQIIQSLRPKKKHPLIEILPDFESYNDDVNVNDDDDDDDIQSPSFIETYDNAIEGSLSEQLYREIDGQTTRRSIVTTKKYPERKNTNNSPSITYSSTLYLAIFTIHQMNKI